MGHGPKVPKHTLGRGLKLGLRIGVPQHICHVPECADKTKGFQLTKFMRCSKEYGEVLDAKIKHMLLRAI